MRSVSVGGAVDRVREFPVDDRSPELLGLGVRTVAGTAATIEDTLRATYTDALVVVHDGRLTVQWYADPERAARPHPLHSVTKSFVGCLAGILIEDGALGDETPVAALVPELGAGGYAAATVRDLLDMRTGGDYLEDHAEDGTELAAMGEIVGWRDTGESSGPDPSRRSSPPGSLREFATSATRIARHGGPFCYRSLDTEVLAWVLEAAAGQPLLRVWEERLLSPLGLEAPGEMLLDPYGVPLASGGLSLVPRDLCRFGQMLLDGGSVGDDQVVPTMFLKDTRVGAPDSVEAFRTRLGERIGPGWSGARPAGPRGSTGIYRNQFWVPARGGRQLLCLGVHGQIMLVDGDNGVVAVKLSQWPRPQDVELFTDGLSCVTAMAEALGGSPHDDLRLMR
ncbi:MAG: serine hydrolase domain-containing protein [Nocardioides sp.]